MKGKKNSPSIIHDAIIKEISEAVGSLDYGDVMIKVHNSRIIQLEVTHRQRFDEAWKIEEGGGI
jgi:hypothetical protein